MAEGFKGIKERDGIHLTFSDKILHLAFVIALGAAMGFFAEYLEYSYYHAPPGSFSRETWPMGWRTSETGFPSGF